LPTAYSPRRKREKGAIPDGRSGREAYISSPGSGAKLARLLVLGAACLGCSPPSRSAGGERVARGRAKAEKLRQHKKGNNYATGEAQLGFSYRRKEGGRGKVSAEIS